jgi:hypothetical protein
MADVRGATGVPLAAAFGGTSTPTPSTPIYVNLTNGDLYVLVGNAVTRVGSATSVGAALTATGSNQATALPLTTSVNNLTTVAAGTGAVLTAMPQQTVFNGGANPLFVYPNSGAQINNLALNAAMILSVNTACTFWYVSATKWIGVLSA